MPDWDRIFGNTAPEMMEGAVDMGRKLGGAGFRWQVTGYFLTWGVPWYVEALRNALGREKAREVLPDFFEKLRQQIVEKAAEENTTAQLSAGSPDDPGTEAGLETGAGQSQNMPGEVFPAEEFLSLVKRMEAAALDESAGRGVPEAAGEDETVGHMSSEELENHIAETAYNIVKVAFTVGPASFPNEQAGEAATWILAVASSSFLHGLELGFGAAAERLRPGFFSRLRHEIREQYQERTDYPVTHYLDIAGSIGRKWLQLSPHMDEEIED